MTLQLAEFAVGAPSVHVPLENVPVPLLLKDTDPVGALAVPLDVSVTVAVHVDGLVTATAVGEQLTAVLVVRWVTVTDAVPALAA